MAQDGHDLDVEKDEMIAVAGDEFVQGTLLPADIFVRLSGNKYVRVAREGSKADLQQMHLAENVENQFYVRRDDFTKCVGQNLVIAGVLITQSELSDAKKAHFLSKTADAVFKEIDHLGFNRESMEHAKIVSRNVQTLVESKSDLSTALELMNGISDDIVRHAMTVAAVSIIIAHKLGWVAAGTLEKIALGSLLHDIGMKELPPDVVNKARREMTYDERAMYETHPFRGMEILRSMPSIPDDILAIAYEHHENSIGQGYPRKLRDYKLNPLGKVVALAIAFAELTMKNTNNPQPRSSEDAIQHIEAILGQPYNKPAFKALKDSLAPAVDRRKKTA